MVEKEKKETEFFDYTPEWETEAEKTIQQLKNIFKEKAADIQHIGGTAMKKIKSKPIIDIIVGIDGINLNSVGSFKYILKINGFIYDQKSDSEKILFSKFEDSNIGQNKIKRKKTHCIYVILHNSKLWFDYIIFRDYMNYNDNRAKDYENLKLSVNGKYKYAIPSFIKAKSDFINKTVAANFYAMMLGKTVTVKLENKISENYPALNDGIYPLNFGYIENCKINGDKKQDVFVIGLYDYHMPEKFTGNIIAYIKKGGAHNEKIFIAAKEGMIFYKPDLYDAVKFYLNANDGDFDIVCFYEKSCGAVLYNNDGGNIKFLLVKGSASNRVGFPKGHIETGETEAETAIREIYEETSLNVVLSSDFKEEYGYIINGYIHKKVIYFLAEFNISDQYQIRDAEILEQWLLPYERAYELLTFGQDKTVLKKAYEKITGRKK